MMIMYSESDQLPKRQLQQKSGKPMFTVFIVAQQATRFALQQPA